MNVRVVVFVLVLATAALAYFGWQRGAEKVQPSATTETTGDMPGMVPAPSGDPAVDWNAPARWASEPAKGMRLATYTVPGASGAADAECAVYYFGPGQGGGVDANISRWVAEFSDESKPQTSTMDVHGIHVSRVKLSGMYLSHSGMGGHAEGEQPNWMLLGAIAEGPNGALFYKLTGPEPTVAAAEKEFDGMLSSISKH